MIYVVGGNGLVGSGIIRYLEAENLPYIKIQRENGNEFVGTSCDLLIYANGNAFKYKANEDPAFDFNATVASTAFYIHNIKFKKYIHISTVDVYDNTSSSERTKEDAGIDTDKLSVYGYHKLLAENYVRHFCDSYLIFRLPGLVGKGLTKNPAYDFINKNKKVMISPVSTMNFIHTDFIAESIFRINNSNCINEVFNLAAYNSMEIRKIQDITGYDSGYTAGAEKNIQNYDINTNKIAEYTRLQSSEDAVAKYFRELEN
jgi:nucleoside-diphosphate-sugar epimerase